MQKRITALAPRDGSADPEKVLRGLLGGGAVSYTHLDVYKRQQVGHQ